MKIKTLLSSFIFLPFLILSQTACSNREKDNDQTGYNTQTEPASSGTNKKFNAGQQLRLQERRGNQNAAGIRRNNSREKGNLNSVILSEAETQAVNIKTVVVSRQAISSELSAMGKVLANQYKKAIVSYPFSARIAQIDAKIGEHVKKGQKLLVLQSEEVGEAIAIFYTADADFELARVNMERSQKLFKKGVGAKKNYLASEAALKGAEAKLNAAEKKLHVLGFTENEIKLIVETHQVNPVISLYAPISGKIVKSNLILGDMVDETTELMTIMDPSLLWVDAEIYEKDIAKIHIGQRVRIRVPAYKEETFTGRVSYIGDMLNEGSRTITVRTEVKNKQNKLKPGMFADLIISLDQSNEVTVVPESAILADKGQQLIFVISNGQYIPHIVKTGTKAAGFVEIVSGIQEGDTVVTVGNYSLKSKLYEENLKSSGVH